MERLFIYLCIGSTSARALVQLFPLITMSGSPLPEGNDHETPGGAPVGALPAPEDVAEHTESEKVVQVGGEKVRMDNLGPIVLNEDGTMSRITNWHEMTEREQENTLRVIGKRNAKRRQALEQKQAAEKLAHPEN